MSFPSSKLHELLRLRFQRNSIRRPGGGLHWVLSECSLVMRVYVMCWLGVDFYPGLCGGPGVGSCRFHDVRRSHSDRAEVWCRPVYTADFSPHRPVVRLLRHANAALRLRRRSRLPPRRRLQLDPGATRQPVHFNGSNYTNRILVRVVNVRYDV